LSGDGGAGLGHGGGYPWDRRCREVVWLRSGSGCGARLPMGLPDWEVAGGAVGGGWGGGASRAQVIDPVLVFPLRGGVPEG
jgi:hypothetical protein